ALPRGRLQRFRARRTAAENAPRSSGFLEVIRFPSKSPPPTVRRLLMGTSIATGAAPDCRATAVPALRERRPVPHPLLAQAWGAGSVRSAPPADRQRLAPHLSLAGRDLMQQAIGKFDRREH